MIAFTTCLLFLRDGRIVYSRFPTSQPICCNLQSASRCVLATHASLPVHPVQGSWRLSFSLSRRGVLLDGILARVPSVTGGCVNQRDSNLPTHADCESGDGSKVILTSVLPCKVAVVIGHWILQVRGCNLKVRPTRVTSPGNSLPGSR